MFSIRDLFSLLNRQKWGFGLILVLGGLLTVGVILFAPRKYRSQARLLLKVGRENASLDPTVTTVGESANLLRTRTSEVNTALQAMKSRSLIEQVVEQVTPKVVLEGTYEPDDNAKKADNPLKNALGWVKKSFDEIDPIDDREKAIRQVQKKLAIFAATDSSVVEIEYQTKSPEVAHDVTNAWVEIYESQHATMNSTKGSFKFFNEQQDLLVKDLGRKRQTLNDLKSELGIVSVEAEQEILKNQFEQIRGNLVSSRTQLAAAEARLSALQQMKDGTSEKVVLAEAVTDGNQSADLMRDRLYQLEIEERKLASRFSKTHPEYKSVLNQLNEARDVFNAQKTSKSEITEGINPLHVTTSEQWMEAKASTEALRAEVAMTEVTLSELNERMQQLNREEARLTSLRREVEALETQYYDHYAKREQARLADELEASQIGSVNVIQPASLERRPVSPNKALCAILGGLGTLLAAFGFCTVREANRDGFAIEPDQLPRVASRRSEQDLETGFEPAPHSHSPSPSSNPVGQSHLEPQLESPLESSSPAVPR